MTQYWQHPQAGSVLVICSQGCVEENQQGGRFSADVYNAVPGARLVLKYVNPMNKTNKKIMHLLLHALICKQVCTRVRVCGRLWFCVGVCEWVNERCNSECVRVTWERKEVFKSVRTLEFFKNIKVFFKDFVSFETQRHKMPHFNFPWNPVRNLDQELAT